ncbi:MAG: hypothetical protein AB7N61_12940 [Acidimicrobiia bacterium]
MREVRSALRERSPFELLAKASSLVELTTERPSDRWAGAKSGAPDVNELVGSFIECGIPEMAVLATAIVTLHTDPSLSLGYKVAMRGRVLPRVPAWLHTMDSIEITDTFVQSDVLGDGENVVVSWRWPDGHSATAIVYVDHNMGTAVKDAFILDESAADVRAVLVNADEAAFMSQTVIAPADVRSRIAEAMATGDMMMPPLVSDTWPVCRPMVEWVIRRLPDGGTGYLRPVWPMADRDELLDEFVASSFGEVPTLQPVQVRELADPLVWFACDYGPGDPLRWSPASAEIVLTDWYARKVLGFSAAEMRRMPDVLAAFVRFAHDRRGIPAALTTETLSSVERWRGVYLDELVGGGDLGEFGVRGPSGLRIDGLSEDEYIARSMDQLETHFITLLGGREAFESMNDEPLPDIAFDWSNVPDDLRELVGETLVLLDRWASEFYDDEVRTTARAVLAALVASDPDVLERSPRPDAIAAALLWWLGQHLVPWGRAIDSPKSLGWAVTTQKELAARTGVSASAISSRSRTIGRAVDGSDIDWGPIVHSSQRRHAIEVRQLVADWRRDHP